MPEMFNRTKPGNFRQNVYSNADKFSPATQGSNHTDPMVQKTTPPQSPTNANIPKQSIIDPATALQTKIGDNTTQNLSRKSLVPFKNSGSGRQPFVNNMLSKDGFNANPSYQNLIGKVAGAVKNAFKVFSDDSHVGAGINPQMLFQESNISKMAEKQSGKRDSGQHIEFRGSHQNYMLPSKDVTNKSFQVQKESEQDAFDNQDPNAFRTYLKDSERFSMDRDARAGAKNIFRNNLQNTGTPSMGMFQDMKVSKPVQVGCNSKKGKLITSDEEVTPPPLRDDTGSIAETYVNKKDEKVTRSKNKVTFRPPRPDMSYLDHIDYHLNKDNRNKNDNNPLGETADNNK